METQAGTKAPTPAVDETTADRKATLEKVDPSPGMARIPAGAAVNGPSSSPPRLKISGIVWHEDPAKRRAVINGTFTSEGSVIEGLKVVEILPTRVRFLHQGRPFEMSIFE
jgi:type II secretory pathway component PulC